MFGSIGPQEILIVLVIALVVLGPKKLPEMARSLGKGVKQFKEGVGEDDTAEEQSTSGSRVHELPLAAPASLADAS
jgi:sec-independent protein translocase protein TatA